MVTVWRWSSHCAEGVEQRQTGREQMLDWSPKADPSEYLLIAVCDPSSSQTHTLTHFPADKSLSNKQKSGTAVLKQFKGSVGRYHELKDSFALTPQIENSSTEPQVHDAKTHNNTSSVRGPNWTRSFPHTHSNPELRSWVPLYQNQG